MIKVLLFRFNTNNRKNNLLIISTYLVISKVFILI